jgi:hypothetical protein
MIENELKIEWFYVFISYYIILFILIRGCRGRARMVVGFFFYNYLYNQCLSPLKLWVRTLFMGSKLKPFLHRFQAQQVLTINLRDSFLSLITYKNTKKHINIYRLVWFMVFNDTFNNISVISWRYWWYICTLFLKFNLIWKIWTTSILSINRGGSVQMGDVDENYSEVNEQLSCVFTIMVEDLWWYVTNKYPPKRVSLV